MDIEVVKGVKLESRIKKQMQARKHENDNSSKDHVL